MLGLPRIAPKILQNLALAAALALGGLSVAPAVAQPAPAAAATNEPAAVTPELKDAVENYWHYGKVARYELAAAEGQKIVALGQDPEMVLRAFEKVAADRKDNLDSWLIRWAGVDQLKDVNAQVTNLVQEGYRARRSSAAFINEQINRLSVNERAYQLAVSRLRESGELAVPFMIDVLRDPAKKDMQPVIRRALRDLGKYIINPMVAATEMKDWDTLTTVVGVLGDVGYPASAPYLARLLELDDAPAAVKQAASESLARLGVAPSQSTKAADLFYNLAEEIYYERSSLSADNRYPTANIWYWTGSGLERKQVPHAIWNEVMAMREAEYTLKLGGARGDDALSLWLASNYKREAELPEGQTDSTRPENYPTGHYWGVESGAKYLEAALARANRDRNSAVAFRAIRSLQEIVGQSNVSSGQSQPLIDATQFPDRRVRFEAAFALAAALPTEGYEGSTRVMPLLAEALAQTGVPSVMVVMPSVDQANKLADELKAAGFATSSATSAETAARAAISLPAIDVILVSEDLGAGNIDQLFITVAENPKLAGAARLVMTKTDASPYQARTASDPMLSTTQGTTAEGLKPAIEAARVKAGSLPMDADVATDYATRAGELMLKVSLARPNVYPLAPAKQSLLGALGDSRPSIVMLAGKVLAQLNDAEAQSGLLIAAADDKASDEVKISLYKSLAGNAKFNGNMLNAEQIQSLDKTVAETEKLDIRAAAAEARGALNLPADQAKTLIVKQSKT